MAHGSCKDGEHEVDFIVHRDQIVGPEEIICAECKVKRIQAKARVEIEGITKKVKELRAARDEQLHLFTGKEPGTGAALPKAQLLTWQHTKDDDGDFWTAASGALRFSESGETQFYRIQSQFVRNNDTGNEARMFVLCGDPGTVPWDGDDVAYLSLEMAQKKCEAIEAEELADNVRAQIEETEEEAAEA